MRAGSFIAAALWAACTLQAPTAAAALSGNEQVSLAGQGRFDALAAGLEPEADAGRLSKAADWHALCFAYARLKRYDRIFGCLDQLEKAFEQADKRTRLFGLEDGTATAWLLRAEAQVEVGQYAEAIQHADRAIAWYHKEKSDDTDLLVDALAAKTLAQLGLGQQAEAEKTAAVLDGVRLGFLDRDTISAKALAQARTSMALGRWQKVLDALDSDRTFGLRSFLDNIASGAYLRGVNAWVWLALPRAYMQTRALMELGRIDDARRGYDQLLAVPEVAANGNIHWLALFDRGRLAEAAGELPQAEQFYQRAAEVIERQRLSINSEANKIGFAGDKQAVYQRLVGVQFALGKFADAFHSVERGKSRALVDLLASRSADPLAEGGRLPAPEVQKVLQEMRAADLQGMRQDELSVRSAMTPGGRGGSRLLARQLPPDLASLVSVSGMDVKEAQGLVAADEALVVYFGDMRRLFALLVQPQGVRGVVIESATLEADIRRLRADMQRGEASVPAQLKALHLTLLAPLAPHIQAKRLSIVPHGVLHYLPFAALNDGSKDLVERYTLRMLPSVGVLKYLRPSGQAGLERLLVFGNPDLNNAKYDLPGAQAEAEQLASKFKVQPANLLLRRGATRTAFQKLAPQARYIHVASHGEFDAGKPLNSGLILAADVPGSDVNAGRLTVADLYRLKLDAEMVTLSACETGLGAIASGDDVVGLTRGFLYAGASTVVASLWQVDDDATAFLMARMYEHLQAGKRAEALQLAQIETRAKYPHPLYWASFYRTGLN